eukprot:s1514_g1.t1
MLPAPVLLGRVASTGQEAVKTLPVPPSQASNHGDDDSRQHDMDQISWSQRCAQASRLAVAMFLATWVSAAVGWKCSVLLGTSFAEDASSFILIWALAGSNAVAGTAAVWLWIIAPTQHLLLASRFLMLNWFGGLSSLFVLQWRSEILCFELICLQYLIHDRFKTIWPDSSAPRRGICLQRVLFIEAMLLCCMACTSGLNICMRQISKAPREILGQGVIAPPVIAQPGEPEPQAFEEVARSISGFLQFAGAACALAVLVFFVYWACRVFSTLQCGVIDILDGSELVARKEANCAAAQALLACSRSTSLQRNGLSSSLVTTAFLYVAAIYDSTRESINAPIDYYMGQPHWSPRPSYFMAIVQCINSLVNVVGVILLSKAHELFRSSLQPPALSWIRPIRLCNCGCARRQVRRPATHLASAWELKTEELARRGICLKNLVDFYWKLFDSERMSFEPPVHTTKDVVRLEIIPQTSAAGISFAELVNDGKEVIPGKMVTHNWSNLFRDLMATIIADALGEHTFEFVAELLCDKEGVLFLTRTLEVHERLQDTYWVCAFAVNQHAGICGANPDGDTDPVTKIPHPVCACKTPKFFNKDPPLNEQGESIMCEMNKFDDMMALLAKKNPNFAEVVAVDADLNLFLIKLLDHVPRHAECAIPVISPRELQHACHKSIRKAAGLDGWFAKMWDCLPLGFFTQLAELWNACLRGAPVPSQWKHIRIALLTKPDGGKRPLAIAALAWRLGMATVMKALRPWILNWIPPELCGGVPAKGIHDVHAVMFQHLQSCRNSNSPFAGCKADVRKCFDSVVPATALTVWKHLGAPDGVLHVLTDFYTQQQRWFSIQNCVAQHPVFANVSILQGCPASPALLNALMTVWVAAMRTQLPTVKLALYLDDRTVWACDRSAAKHVLEAMVHSGPIDRALGFALHPDKLECFALRKCDRDFLNTYTSEVGPVKLSFKLLGIQYFIGSNVLCHQDSRLHQAILTRCRKIRMVTNNIQLRKLLVQMLVVSMLRWMGPWQRFRKDTLRGWATAIETAIWGHKTPPGRSKYLFWTIVANLRCYPACALDVEAILSEWRRQVAVMTDRPSLPSTPHRAAVAMQRLGWSTLSNHIWSTPFGQIRVGWISDMQLSKLIRLSWARVLYNQDSKTHQSLAPRTVPYHGFHDKFVNEGKEKYSLTVLMAAATDGRILARMNNATCCTCGLPNPDREHLTFVCKSQAGVRPPLRSQSENRLLLPLVSMPQRTPCPGFNPDANLVHFLSAQYLKTHLPVVLAIDGSCLILPGHELHQWASWAVVGSASAAFHGPLHGCVQNPAAAEREALFQALMAAATAQVPVRLLVDNEANVQRLQRGLLTGQWTGDIIGFWLRIAKMTTHGVEAMWVPSHDKRPLWTPQADWGLTAVDCRRLNQLADTAATAITERSKDLFLVDCRRLNQLADTAATAITERSKDLFLRSQQELTRAHAWAQHVIQRQKATTLPFHEDLVHIMQLRADPVCYSFDLQSTILNLFQRAWCVAELAEAHRLGMAQKLFLRNKATLMTRQSTLQGLQVENMRASRPEDVQQILSKIPDKVTFNKKLQELIFDGNVGLLAAWRKADVLQHMEDLSYILKWARFSRSVHNGALIWRRTQSARKDEEVPRAVPSKVKAISTTSTTAVAVKDAPWFGETSGYVKIALKMVIEIVDFPMKNSDFP